MTGEFDSVVADYVAEKRAVGYRYDKEERQLRAVVLLHAEMGCAPDSLPKEAVLAFVELRPNERESTRLGRMCLIRGLASYMERIGLDAYVLPGRIGWADRDAYQPHIFTDAELAGIFAAADAYAEGEPLSPRGQHAVIFRLLYSTGMRVGEACGLEKSDVDLDAGAVLIRQAKNDKDRRIPLHPNMLSRLSYYVARASENLYWRTHDRFWCLPDGRQMTPRSVYGTFRKCLWDAGISHGGRGNGPRIHDVRFTFACHTLRNWVRDGSDINALMPYLATYMGHADTRCTEYYLKLIAELYPDIAAKAEEKCGWMIPEGVGS